MLTELQNVHDAQKMIYSPCHSILLPTFEYMTKFFLSSMPLHGTSRKNVIWFAIRYFFLILTQINYIWTTQIKIYFLSIIWIASSCHVFISSVISANRKTPGFCE